LGQRKGKEITILLIQRFKNGKTEWNLWYSRHRE
jgi:hypothetical protein